MPPRRAPMKEDRKLKNDRHLLVTAWSQLPEHRPGSCSPVCLDPHPPSPTPLHTQPPIPSATPRLTARASPSENKINRGNTTDVSFKTGRGRTCRCERGVVLFYTALLRCSLLHQVSVRLRACTLANLNNLVRTAFISKYEYTTAARDLCWWLMQKQATDWI